MNCKYILLYCLIHFFSNPTKAQVIPQGFLVNPNGNGIAIGSQFWATKNLDTLVFNNGDPIPNYTNGSVWGSLTTPAMCSYNFDANNDAIYGKLYNWYAIVDSRGICPVGWHVPSNDEFITLNTFVSGNGGQLKQSGIKTINSGALWISPNTGALDTYGFKALPSGYMGTSTPSGLGNVTYFWTSSSYSTTRAYTWSLSKDNANFTSASNNTKVGGFSVRCIRD